MLSSDDFFANSPARPEQSASKRARVDSDGDDDDILALLDEIDAVTATCDTFASVTNMNNIQTDPFNGHTLPITDSVDSVTTAMVQDSIDPPSVTTVAQPTVNNVAQPAVNTEALYLPHPFTAESDTTQSMIDNINALNLSIFTKELNIQTLVKIDRLCGFVVDYERVGQNYRVTLAHHSNSPPIIMTCQGAVFKPHTCHYGMLLLLHSVTCYQGHFIVTVSNVEQCYLNYHIVN